VKIGPERSGVSGVRQGFVRFRAGL